jgi:2'-phosphotransferase
MSRQHVHLAPALSDHRITPRPTSTLLIYLDLSKLLAGGIPVYVSTNGVVLTPGNEAGVVSKDYWMKAERVYGSLGKGGKRVVVWENGQEVGQAVASVTEEPLGSS